MPAKGKPNASAFPASIGDAIDKLYMQRAARLEADRAIERMKEEERALKAHVLKLLTAAKLNGGKGAIATAAIVMSRTYRLEPEVGFAKFWEFARKDKLGVYVQHRISASAVAEAIGAGKRIPGVVEEDVVDISLNKVGAKP